jgi:hypothetical protein
MPLVQHNYQPAHQTELNVLQKLLVQHMLKLDANQELESDKMVFVSGIQLLQLQPADLWLVEML